MKSNEKIYLHSPGVACSLGDDVASVNAALFAKCPENSFFTLTDQYSSGRNLPLGLVNSELPRVSIAGENTRNNRLLTKAVEPMVAEIERYKAHYGAHRCAAIVGTSTSGIADGEVAVRHFLNDGKLPANYDYAMQEVSAPSRYLANYLGFRGPSWTVSSACTSGGKALTSAARLLRLGVCDMVVAGGVDTLCEMTVAGFSSLGVTSESVCRPFSKHRSGINIGEAAAFFILTRDSNSEGNGDSVILAGSGETSDAYHISAPHPEGKGAEHAMRLALSSASMVPGDIDYLNFHGTGTAQNDKMEALAAHRVFGESIACGSTKSLTGHTLGAAGALEAVFCWLTLQANDGRLPNHNWDGERDTELPTLSGLAASSLAVAPKVAMSNSFAFGGNNLALIMAREN